MIKNIYDPVYLSKTRLYHGMFFVLVFTLGRSVSYLRLRLRAGRTQTSIKIMCPSESTKRE